MKISTRSMLLMGIAAAGMSLAACSVDQDDDAATPYSSAPVTVESAPSPPADVTVESAPSPPADVNVNVESPPANEPAAEPAPAPMPTEDVEVERESSSDVEVDVDD